MDTSETIHARLDSIESRVRSWGSLFKNDIMEDVKKEIQRLVRERSAQSSRRGQTHDIGRGRASHTSPQEAGSHAASDRELTAWLEHFQESVRAHMEARVEAGINQFETQWLGELKEVRKAVQSAEKPSSQSQSGGQHGQQLPFSEAATARIAARSQAATRQLALDNNRASTNDEVDANQRTDVVADRRMANDGRGPMFCLSFKQAFEHDREVFHRVRWDTQTQEFGYAKIKVDGLPTPSGSDSHVHTPRENETVWFDYKVHKGCTTVRSLSREEAGDRGLPSTSCPSLPFPEPDQQEWDKSELKAFLESNIQSPRSDPVHYQIGEPPFAYENLDCGSVLKDALVEGAEFPGITSPYFYFNLSDGPSMTVAHMEDACLASKNITLSGAMKVVIFITPGSKDRFEKLVFDLFGKYDDTNDSQWIRHHSMVVPPSLLDQYGIQYAIDCFGPGYGFATIDREAVYHMVVNMGNNVSTAVNFATEGVLPDPKAQPTPLYPEWFIFCSHDHDAGEEGHSPTIKAAHFRVQHQKGTSPGRVTRSAAQTGSHGGRKQLPSWGGKGSEALASTQAISRSSSSSSSKANGSKRKKNRPTQYRGTCRTESDKDHEEMGAGDEEEDENDVEMEDSEMHSQTSGFQSRPAKREIEEGSSTAAWHLYLRKHETYRPLQVVDVKSVAANLYRLAVAAQSRLAVFRLVSIVQGCRFEGRGIQNIFRGIQQAETKLGRMRAAVSTITTLNIEQAVNNVAEAVAKIVFADLVDERVYNACQVPAEMWNKIRKELEFPENNKKLRNWRLEGTRFRKCTALLALVPGRSQAPFFFGYSKLLKLRDKELAAVRCYLEADRIGSTLLQLSGSLVQSLREGREVPEYAWERLQPGEQHEIPGSKGKFWMWQEDEMERYLRIIPYAEECTYNPDSWKEIPRPSGWPEDTAWPIHPGTVSGFGQEALCHFCAMENCDCADRLAATSESIQTCDCAEDECAARCRGRLQGRARRKFYISQINDRKRQGLRVAGTPGQVIARKNDVLFEVKGEIVSPADAAASRAGYLWDVVRKGVADGKPLYRISTRDTGNEMAKVNHECEESTIRVEGMVISGMYRLVAIAERRVVVGDEITATYGDKVPFPCGCSTCK